MKFEPKIVPDVGGKLDQVAKIVGVSDEYDTGDNEFTGTVHWVQIDIDEKAEDLDHLITPEERWQIAMARQ